MNNSQIDALLDKLASGRSTTTEEQQVRHFIHRYSADGSSGLSDDDFLEAENEMWEVIEKACQPKVRRIPIWKLAIAAAVTAIIFGIWFYISRPIVNHDPQIVNQNDILPGRIGATLTLANGKQIRLADALKGELAKEAGVVISKSEDGQVTYQISGAQANASARETGKSLTNTLSTSKGETYAVILPDKSKVWLNTLSSLTYTTALNEHGLRRVKLEGEAYFEVAKDKAHPFIVESNGQEVKVLGTHFNISSYPDESSVKTTLLEGSVRVASIGALKIANRKPAAVTLIPNQSAVLSEGVIKVETADTEEALAWKNGYFRFNKESIVDIMHKLSRWYNIEVTYEGPVSQEEFSGTASREKPISQVLKMLQYSKSVQFRVEGRRIIVTQ